MQTSHNTEREKLVKNILENMNMLRRKIVFHKHDHAEITPAQWGILSQIFEHGAQTTNDLARHFGLTKSAITQQVNALVQKKALLREASTQDRRQIFLQITPEFRQKKQACHDKLLTKFAEIFGVLSDTELKNLSKIYQKITENLNHKE